MLTIHSAKGLEFPVVFVLGLHPGELPYRPPPRLGAEEEDLLEYERQRTLLYVAMTRAAEALHLVTAAGEESPLLGDLGDWVWVEPWMRIDGHVSDLKAGRRRFQKKAGDNI